MGQGGNILKEAEEEGAIEPEEVGVGSCDPERMGQGRGKSKRQRLKPGRDDQAKTEKQKQPSGGGKHTHIHPCCPSSSPSFSFVHSFVLDRGIKQNLKEGLTGDGTQEEEEGRLCAATQSNPIRSTPLPVALRTNTAPFLQKKGHRKISEGQANNTAKPSSSQTDINPSIHSTPTGTNCCCFCC